MRLVTPRLAEIRWRRPAVSNGQIIRYTAYAIPIAVSGSAISKRQAASNLPSRTIKQVCLQMWLYIQSMKAVKADAAGPVATRPSSSLCERNEVVNCSALFQEVALVSLH